jgi:flagellar L-ring protein precursor FlgH
VLIGSLLIAAALWFTAAAAAEGPSSSLFGSPQRRQALTLPEYSWTYPKEVDEVRLNDLITVIVDEKSAVISEGEMDRKKKAHGDLILKDWILFDGLSFIPDPQTLGDPHVRGEVDNKMRSEAGLETRDSMKFRIACRVMDIRPNGNLVIEGHRTVRNNAELWEQSLTGEVRPKDVLPNNSVLSENVAELRIDKHEAGHVRDGYRRGWLLRWLDRWQPF